MSGPFTPEELSKLPKWVQEKIGMLQRQIQDQKIDIADLSAALDIDNKVTPGAVEIDPYGKMSGLEYRGPRCFPARTAVDFHLEKYGVLRVQMKQVGTLEIMSTHGTVALRPHSANLVTVTTEK